MKAEQDKKSQDAKGGLVVGVIEERLNEDI